MADARPSEHKTLDAEAKKSVKVGRDYKILTPVADLDAHGGGGRQR